MQMQARCQGDVTYKSICIRELVIVCNNAPDHAQLLPVGEQLLLVTKDKPHHLLQSCSGKPLALLTSVPLSVSTGNERANKQTEIITDQTIAVISFCSNLLALASHQHNTVYCNLCPLGGRRDRKHVREVSYVYSVSVSLLSLPLLPQNKAC